MSQKFYITTTLPYVNAEPHIGFAKEIIQADVLARFHRTLGDAVFFNTGTDEHGLKIFRKAEELGVDIQKYCSEQAAQFDKLKQALNLSYDKFIRTTDAKHIVAAQEFWKVCDKNGDIYKKNYKIKYCVGCELEKTDSELVDGMCPLHPKQELEVIEEENYFFRFSKYQNNLLKLYENTNFVVPAKRLHEVKKFVEKGLEDFSISRLKSKMPWGVPVPGDEDHVMYVWFDALVNYISTLGWPNEKNNFEKFWPGVQLCGKDNLRQQAAMWQAMLFSAGIENSKQIFVNGFITVGGQKMSKSQGNVISPYDMVEKFGVDATRYLLLSGSGFGEDFDITWEKLTEKYNADLANGLGNLISRVVKLIENLKIDLTEIELATALIEKESMMSEYMDKMDFTRILMFSGLLIQKSNVYIEENKPWELAKRNAQEFEAVMKKLYLDLYVIAEYLDSFMPETSEKIKKALETKKVEPLFQRIR